MSRFILLFSGQYGCLDDGSVNSEPTLQSPPVSAVQPSIHSSIVGHDDQVLITRYLECLGGDVSTLPLSVMSNHNTEIARDLQ